MALTDFYVPGESQSYALKEINGRLIFGTENDLQQMQSDNLVYLFSLNYANITVIRFYFK